MNFKQIKDKLFPAKTGINANKAAASPFAAKSESDSRNKKMAILMSVLIVVFIFIIVRVIKTSPGSANAQVSAKANGKNSAGVGEKKIKWEIPDVYPKTLRDPMQAKSPVAGQEGSGNLIIKGIMYSKDRPSAVINDQIVHQGNKILGAVVVKINKNNVEFEMDGKNWTQEVQR
jgi:hypothetical protein